MAVKWSRVHQSVWVRRIMSKILRLVDSLTMLKLLRGMLQIHRSHQQMAWFQLKATSTCNSNSTHRSTDHRSKVVVACNLSPTLSSGSITGLRNALVDHWPRLLRPMPMQQVPSSIYLLPLPAWLKHRWWKRRLKARSRKQDCHPLLRMALQYKESYSQRQIRTQMHLHLSCQVSSRTWLKALSSKKTWLTRAM